MTDELVSASKTQRRKWFLCINIELNWHYKKILPLNLCHS